MFIIKVDDTITLKPLDLRDTQTSYDVIIANKAFIGRFLPFANKTEKPEQTEQFIRRTREDLAQEKGIHCGIWYEGEFIGTVSLTVRAELSRVGEIGYWLAESATGKGVITRCVRVLVDYGFSTMKLNRIMIRCAPTNTASCGVAERLQFTYEGTLRQDGIIADGFTDLKLYSIIASEWQHATYEPRLKFRIDEEIELRLPTTHESQTLFDLVDANRDYLRQWLPWLNSNTEVEHSKSFIASSRQQYAKWNGVQAGIWHQDELVGMIGYHYWDFSNRKTELGYWLSEHVTGQGIMTKVVRSCIDYAFADLDLNRVTINCATKNDRSCAIPRRLGFQHEGILRQSEWLYDHFVDWHCFSVLAKDWQQSNHSKR